jgi:outer membrane protein assembly factor BamA
MKKQSKISAVENARWRTIRRGTTPLRFRRAPWLLLLGLFLLLVSTPAFARETPPDSLQIQPATARTLYLAEVQLSGATRTDLSTVFRYLPLHPGQAIDQTALVEAVDELRNGGVFKSVSFFTRPGAERGHLILVLEVEEHTLDFRWAAGNTDLDGWYLVPAMLAYDNPLGHGGLFDLQFRFGFRHSGFLLRYGQPRSGDGKNYWGTQLSAISTDRRYYSAGEEYRHEVKTAGLATVFGRRFSKNRLAELGLTLEGINVARHSEAYIQTEDGISYEDVIIPEEDLLPEIRAGVGKDARAILHLDWQYDNRSSEKQAGTPVSGIWGRLLGRYIIQDKYSHPGFQADLRAYRKMPGGVLAARLRASWVGNNSHFYDRLYIGGMYSVRGFPTHSLSAPGGDTRMWSGSLEYRNTILGDAKGTKLAGVLFVDAGRSHTSDAEDPYDGVAVGAGYGLRLRVWWLDWVGVDIGFPVTERPQGIRFQGTASIGWSF